MRVDFNVPIINGEITDDNRIVQALPSINYVLDQGAKLVLCSHLGRPKGNFVAEYSLEPVAKHLASLVSAKVHFAPDCIGEEAKKQINIKCGSKIVEVKSYNNY